VNLPLFSNEERAIVGTSYAQEGKEEAVLRGLDLVGARLRSLAESLRSLLPGNSALIHCWRGGMRSGSVGWLAEFLGFEVYTLEGGYKSYRRHVLDSFEMKRNIITVGGRTGSRKTAILQELANLGEQMIDLEKLASHRGSAFGALGQGKQPTQEQFENDLEALLNRSDPERPLWLEDESRMIGRKEIPRGLFLQMREARLFFLDVPRDVRVKNLVEEYGSFPIEDLCRCVENIKKRLGGLNAQNALQALGEGDAREACKIVLDYYDRTYDYGLMSKKSDCLKVFAVSLTDPESLALRLREAAAEP